MASFILQMAVAFLVFYFIAGNWILQAAHMGLILGLLVVLPHLFILSPYILFLKKGSRWASGYFLFAWVAMEFVQSWFQLGSPFYNLGNNLAARPEIIQWYSFTGSTGGTIWIVLINLLFLSLTKSVIRHKAGWLKPVMAVSVVVFLPVFISLIIYHTWRERGVPAEVLIVHPATDNSDIKYRVNIYELMDIYLGLVNPHLTDRTEYVVLPETSITNAGWETDFNRNLVFDRWYERTADHPGLKLVTGAITYEVIPDVKRIKGYERNPGIRYSQNYKTWYNTYNAALLIEKGRPVQIRVKEGLVPYSEYAPYPRIMPRLAPIGIDLQFSRRKSDSPVFKAGDHHKTTALICYELVYGRLFSRAARKGAEAFFVILNEGWYDVPRVSRQFLQLSVIRAIENRRCVAQSSNMGISAFVNQKGEVTNQADSKYPAILKKSIHFNSDKTPASIMGSSIDIACCLIALLMLGGKIIDKIRV